MSEDIRVLVVEDDTSAGPKVAAMLRGAGMQVHVVESCEQAMNKMLEYMDLIVVNSRIRGCMGKTLELIKGRVSTTHLVAVCPARELDSVRLGGRVRADEYVSLDCDPAGFRLLIQAAYARSPRAAVIGARAARRRFFAAA